MEKTYYIIPSYKCNLKCSHCFLYKREDNFNQQKFFESLKTINGICTLFGGQPTLNFNIFKKCLQTKKIDNMSTNLLFSNRQIIDLIKQYDLYIATSWNNFRFNDEQYDLWKRNLIELKNKNIHTTVLITLTEDLVNIYPKKLIQRIKTWETEQILFQPIIDMNESLREKSDSWLCEIDDLFPSHIINKIKQKYINGNINTCQQTYTLKPNGNIEHNCPMFEGKLYINKQCIQCKYSKICRPCILQKQCTFFKKFYGKVIDFNKSDL